MEAVSIISLSCVLHKTPFGGRVTGMSGTRGRILVRLLMVLDREIEGPTVIISWFQMDCPQIVRLCTESVSSIREVSSFGWLLVHSSRARYFLVKVKQYPHGVLTVELPGKSTLQFEEMC
jgi:hypothetical protein